MQVRCMHAGKQLAPDDVVVLDVDQTASVPELPQEASRRPRRRSSISTPPSGHSAGGGLGMGLCPKRHYQSQKSTRAVREAALSSVPAATTLTRLSTYRLCAQTVCSLRSLYKNQVPLDDLQSFVPSSQLYHF